MPSNCANSLTINVVAVRPVRPTKPMSESFMEVILAYTYIRRSKIVLMLSHKISHSHTDTANDTDSPAVPKMNSIRVFIL
jgi:hypothetical protein